MNGKIMYSIVVPVYNRPAQIQELLESIQQQILPKPIPKFEVLITEDGSTQDAGKEIQKYKTHFPIQHIFSKTQKGPAQTRNYGASEAKGSYLIFVDSDVILEKNYLSTLSEHLRKKKSPFLGGPDDILPEKASAWQKAVHHAMTSLWTTGGIRGGTQYQMENFKPRTHNMCVLKNLFHKIGGFIPNLRYGEDIDFAIRMEKKGYPGEYLPNLRIAHQRKSDKKSFFQQVYASGQARRHLAHRHPGSTRWVHILPVMTVFSLIGLIIIGMVFSLKLFFGISLGGVLILLGYGLIHGYSLHVAYLFVVATCIQILGYGLGFGLSYLHRKTSEKN
ncbi:MAG: glycosyltransferase [Cytophagales bacterium]|nr:glycosyltransferase [Cytophagales bacterium]